MNICQCLKYSCVAFDPALTAVIPTLLLRLSFDSDLERQILIEN